MTVTNADRASWAAEALGVFKNRTKMHGEDAATIASDLLCDLMHLADAVGWSFDDALRRGREAYRHEAIIEGNGRPAAPSAPPRKVVQIASVEGQRGTGYLHALLDDGSMWEMSHRGIWYRVPGPPGTEPQEGDQ